MKNHFEDPVFLEKVYGRPLTFLTIIYFLSYFLMPLNNGVFWDDWHYHFYSNQDFIEYWAIMSRPFHGLMLVGMRLLTHSHYLVSAIAFFSFLTTGLIFYKILRRLNFYSRAEAFWIGAILIIFPQVYCRLVSSIIVYSLSINLFMLASYFYIFSQRNYFFKTLTLLSLFFISFNLESLLFFYAVPVLLRYYVQNNFSIPLKRTSILSFIFKEKLFFLLPFAYVVVIKYFYPPSPGYNAIPADALINFFPLTWRSFQVGYVDVFFNLFKGSKSAYILFLPVIAMIVGFKWSPVDARKNLIGLFASILFLLFSILPYMLVGKEIGYYNILDRNMLVALFACALLTYYVVALAFSFTKISWVRTIFLVLLLVLFTRRNYVVYRSFLITSVKQDSLRYHIAKNPEFSLGTTFLWDDHTVAYFPKNTPLESTETRGLVRSIFKTPNKCSAHTSDPTECSTPSPGHACICHNVFEYTPTPNQYLVQVGYGSRSMREDLIYRLIVKKIFLPELYQKQVPEVIELKITPI